MRTQQEDLEYGINNERVALASLEELTGKKLAHTGKYSLLDFADQEMTVYVELKSRRFAHNKYETTYIGKKKIDQCSNPNIDYYLAFLFTDGLYYIKYDKELFSGFRIEEDFQYRRYNCYTANQTLVHIPVQYLTKYTGSKIMSP
jgi:hypothetical protein